MNHLKSIVGLFVPVPYNIIDTSSFATRRVWRGSIEVAGIPLGWYMVAVSLAVNLLSR